MAEIKTEKLRVGSGDLTSTPYSTLSSGTAAPNNANGTDGDVYIRIAGSNSDIYVKRSGSWLSVATSFANAQLSNLVPPTNINQNLLFDSSEIFNIGALGANRPDNIYAKTSINSAGSLSAGTSLNVGNLSTNTLLQSDGSKNVTSFTNGADGQILTMTAGLPSWQNPASSSANGFNYISNSDAETNTSFWNTYADAASSQPVDGTGGSPNITWTRSTSNALRGVASFIFTKDAANRQGQGVSTDFTIQNADLAKILTVTFDYSITSGTYADGDLTVYLIQDPSGTPLVIQPSGYTIQSAAGGTKMRQISTFQTSSTATSYRLCFHVASTSALAYTVQIDNVVTSPQTVQYGAPVTDWQSYTPTISNPPGGVSGNTANWRRVGGNLQVIGKFLFTSSGAVSAVGISLPSGLNIDMVKMANSGVTTDCGTCALFNEGSAYYPGVAVASNGSTTVINFLSTVNNSNRLLASNFTTTTTGSFSYSFEVPILGWSSTVQMSSDTDTRVVSSQFGIGTSSLAHTAGAVIIYPTIHYDTHGAYNNSTGTWTCPVSGVYDFYSSEYYSSGATYIQIYKNNVYEAMLSYFTASSGVQSFSHALKLNAGDQITFKPTNSVSTTYAAGFYQNKITITRRSGPSAIAATEKVYLLYTGNGGAVATADVTNVDFTTKVVDSHGAWTGNNTFTAPRAGFYLFDGLVNISAQPNVNTELYIGGVQKLKSGPSNSGLNMSRLPFNLRWYMNAGETATVRLDVTSTLSNSAVLHWISISSQG